MFVRPATAVVAAALLIGAQSDGAVPTPAPPPPAAAPVASVAAAPKPQLVAVRARIRQLEGELALNTSALLDKSLTDPQRQGLQARAAQLGGDLNALRLQERVLAP